MGSNSSTSMNSTGTDGLNELNIKSIVSKNDIVVFESRGCPYCDDAVENLKSAGYSPIVIDATKEQRNELAIATGSRTVPSVWLKGKFVGGCNDGPEPWMGINKIIRSNSIDEYLK